MLYVYYVGKERQLVYNLIHPFSRELENQRRRIYFHLLRLKITHLFFSMLLIFKAFRSLLINIASVFVFNFQDGFINIEIYLILIKITSEKPNYNYITKLSITITNYFLSTCFFSLDIYQIYRCTLSHKTVHD